VIIPRYLEVSLCIDPLPHGHVELAPVPADLFAEVALSGYVVGGKVQAMACPKP
jgi:hypothetical protein